MRRSAANLLAVVLVVLICTVALAQTQSAAPGKFHQEVHSPSRSVVLTDKNADLCQKVTGSRDTWPVWDEVAVAHLLGLTQSRVYPRPIMREDTRFIHRPRRARGATITWIVAINSQLLWENLTARLEQANSRFRAQAVSVIGAMKDLLWMPSEPQSKALHKMEQAQIRWLL